MKLLCVIVFALLTALVLLSFGKTKNKIINDVGIFESEKPAAVISPVSSKEIISCTPGEKNSYESRMEMPVKKHYYPTPNGMEEIFTNDNRKTAGNLENGVLTVNLEARDGIWFPETHEGKGIHVFAFAETGKPLQLPGPVIRVSEGTLIKASIHNTLDSPLVMHGFCSRPAIDGNKLVVAPGDTYHGSFYAGIAGTYFYRATASDSLTDDGLPYFNDSQLYGAFIVDPANKKPDPKERIIMIGIWNDTIQGIYNGGEELAINGLTWPYTERLTYRQGEEVNWRVINASIQPHPMHLHGFFFTVKSKGDLYRDSIYKNENFRKAVTELLQPGETVSLQWIPERPGNWLFHCHTLVHITPGSFLRKVPAMEEMNPKDLQSHVINDMGGLIMGLHVLPAGKKWVAADINKTKERALTLIIKEKPSWYDTLTGKGFVLLEGNRESDEDANIPGPPIILNRNEPVSIKVINKLKEATTVHWHGLEIESYFDGVSGWSNIGKRLAPLIQPGDSFVVHLTPPRSGTFIYHTHMHNEQLLAGMYGAIIVKEPGEDYDDEINKIFVIGQGGHDIEARLFFINGKRNTDTLLLSNGKPYYFRIINITALGPRLNVSLLHNEQPVNWQMIAKDGADLPMNQQIIKPAAAQTISVGETIDFKFQPDEAGDYQFEVRNKVGTLFVSKTIRVVNK